MSAGLRSITLDKTKALGISFLIGDFGTKDSFLPLSPEPPIDQMKAGRSGKSLEEIG